jgi:hypothetical protein
MLLKILKESTRGIRTIATSVATGIVFSLSYLLINGFKCLTDNLNTKVIFNAKGLNVTTFIQEIENALATGGNVNLPISTQISDTNVGACANPVIVGAAIGLGYAALDLTFNYARQCAKSKAKRHQERENSHVDSPLLLNSAHSSSNLCC